ncbi:hypothetical protein Q8W40_15385 [Vibrio penaeicida]|uniref:hypothetical protein n=1 Tax=Vibrio penaeicida TaxID=104609 RepID=UPI002736029A|nr:hypothetical protein [Vibrio penaeicida]MDP2573576.1 hypothetical protein [Vibrio penaeicida]
MNNLDANQFIFNPDKGLHRSDSFSPCDLLKTIVLLSDEDNHHETAMPFDTFTHFELSARPRTTALTPFYPRFFSGVVEFCIG